MFADTHFLCSEVIAVAFSLFQWATKQVHVKLPKYNIL